jgi:DNA polymerase III subunit epsilon
VRLPRHRRAPASAAARAYEGAKPAGSRTPWRQARYAVVDLETTGLDPSRDEIISFASVPIDEGRVVVGRVATAIARPARMPGPETMRIHGLRPIDLADAAPLAEVLDVVLEALTGRVMVAHVAAVERGFLAPALKRAGLSLAMPVLDTDALAGQVLGTNRAGDGAVIPLADAARELGLPVHSPHVAEGDALTTAQLFLALATRLDRMKPQTVGSLERLSKARPRR